VFCAPSAQRIAGAGRKTAARLCDHTGQKVRKSTFINLQPLADVHFELPVMAAPWRKQNPLDLVIHRPVSRGHGLRQLCQPCYLHSAPAFQGVRHPQRLGGLRWHCSGSSWPKQRLSPGRHAGAAGILSCCYPTSRMVSCAVVHQLFPRRAAACFCDRTVIDVSLLAALTSRPYFIGLPPVTALKGKLSMQQIAVLIYAAQALIDTQFTNLADTDHRDDLVITRQMAICAGADWLQ